MELSYSNSRILVAEIVTITTLQATSTYIVTGTLLMLFVTTESLRKVTKAAHEY